MRNLGKAMVGLAFVALSGCGCLERLNDGPYLLGGSHPDPDQPEWHRCLFGTRRIPMHPYLPSVQELEGDNQKASLPR